MGRSWFDWLSWNSWIALAPMFVVVEPKISSEMSMPSTSMRVVRPDRPPIEKAKLGIGLSYT